MIPLLAQAQSSGTEAVILVAMVFIALAVVVVFALILFSALYKKTGPNEVLVISGKFFRSADKGFRTVRGGGTFVKPVIERVDRLSLEIMTLDVRTPEVYTSLGVPLVVDGVAQVKINSDQASIDTAAEQFLSKTEEQIRHIALETIEGHLRAVLGTLSVEEIYRERDRFAQQVAQIATPDMANMGLRVVSFVIKNISDNNGYLDALGKPRTAQVKRDAIIGQAEADRDAMIKSADANQEGQIARLAAEVKIAEADRDYRIKLQEYEGSVNIKKAEAELAYDIQRNKTLQLSKAEEVRIEAVEREGKIKVQEMEIQRRERELDATVRKPAEAEKYRIETLAEAKARQLQREAEGEAVAKRARGTAEADVVKLTGTAEADANRAKGLASADIIKAEGLSSAEVVRVSGLAEAEANRAKAEAWALYTGAALAQIIIDKLPEIAREIAAPLAKTERITMVSMGGESTGASKITKDITQIIASLPPMVESLTGVKLEDLVSDVRKKKGEDGEKKG